MKLLIISHVVHGKSERYFGYGPYVREINVWNKYADEVVVIAPLDKISMSAIDLEYKHDNLALKEIATINFQSVKNIFWSISKMPFIFLTIFREMKSADHIHLRCPGNIGLIGCVAQVFFPSKPKSAKYAGNWDPQSKQPLSYKIQKWILSSTFLTRNMQVLVYGDCPNQSKNIKAFFTASYSEVDKHSIVSKSLEEEIKFLFVGSLSLGKRPLYAVQIVEELQKLGKNVSLELYGEGSERKKIESYIKENQLQRIVLHGNQNEEIIRNAYKSSHFLVLPSKSEGWPKVVAEAMFWKCAPISTPVSCVPYMLDQGDRGILLQMNLEEDVNQILQLCENEKIYQEMAASAMDWSRNFTLDLFEAEIKKIL